MCIKTDIVGRYIEGEITVSFRSYLNKDTINLTEDEAIGMLNSELDNIGSSYKGYELLCSAEVKLVI